ncbi:MAG: FkbM family methyltransferase [Solirubrobacteraceae bacterium]
MPTARYAFPSISVAGRPPVELCIDLDAGDEVAPWLLEHDWIDEPVQRAFLDWVRPGMRVIDLGSHLGVFSLPAAAAGAAVLAVDAAPRHIEQVRLAAFRNGFAPRYHAVWAAFTEASHPVEFVVDSIHGHVLTAADPEWTSTLKVPSAQVDDLLDELGWDSVDVIKMDIEGGELAALRGMTRLFSRGCRPVIVFESNGSMLPLFGASTYALRVAIVAHGYELLQIDHRRPGLLVETTTEAVQADAVADYIALPAGGPKLPDHWSIEPAPGIDALAVRMADEGAKDAAPFRSYIAAVIHDGPDWLRDHPVVASLLRALRGDLDGFVTAAARRGAQPPAAVADVAAPDQNAEPADTAVWARELVLHAPRPGLDRPPGWEGPRDVGAPQLTVSFHANAGQMVGILGAPEATALMLRGLSGEVGLLSGELQVSGRVLDLTRLAAGLEPGLCAADNVLVLTAHFGGDPGGVDPEDLCAQAGLSGREEEEEAPLQSFGAAAAASLALLVALAQFDVDVMLVGEVPRLTDEGVAARVRDRILARRREDGLALLQAIATPDDALSPPDRLVWLAADGTALAGHPDSVAEAFWRERLGLPVVPLDLEPPRPLGWRP